MDPNAPTAPVARLLARAAALLIFLGLLTGIYAADAMTGKLPADPHDALASHLSALLGAFLLLAVAVTLPLLRYGAVGQRRLAWAFIVPNFSNWFITGVKAWFHLSGLAYTGELGNDLVFIALAILVVLPSLGSAAAWFYGLGAPATTKQSAQLDAIDS